MVAIINPVPGFPITDTFGYRDAIPGVAPAMLHDGFDIAAPIGTHIRAAHAGTVQRKWWDVFKNGDPAGGYATAVVADGFETRYYHQNEPSPLPIGAEVAAGDFIGYTGNTGASTGPHCHITLEIYGTGVVDPLLYLVEDTNIEDNDMGYIYIQGKEGVRMGGLYIILKGSTAVFLGATEVPDGVPVITNDEYIDDLRKHVTGIF